MRVIVVGSGLAGLLAAVTAAERGADVLLLTKAALADANTTHAQGGIAAALFPDDSVAAHVRDTLVAGAGLCSRAAVEVLCTEGPARVRELIARGVRFDADAAGGLARGLEAAHSSARILHAGGDATGAEIERALIAAARASARVSIREHAVLVDLVVDGGAVVGVSLLGGDEYADAVVLATGGAGQLFAHTTNPAVATGDGVAAAWRAGAELADAEFYQFHPTALAAPGSFLISEAVRGEGAVLRNAAGRRFMLDVHPDAELAPRDVVARGIATEMAAQGGEPVVLDATGIGARLAARFPTIDAATRAAGFDWTREPIPVTPAAHYWMGGIATDVSGRTSLPGLWAVGECASTGVHGANRLASNSLLEAAVFAHRAVEDLLAATAPAGSPVGTSAQSWAPALCTSDDRREGAQPVVTSAQSSAPRLGASDDSRGGARPVGTSAQSEAAGLCASDDSAFSRPELQELMWGAAGLQRSGAGLAAAASALAELRAPQVRDATSAEDRNLLDLARVLVDFALAREESRGAHYRTDFPTPSPELAERRIAAGFATLSEGAPAC